MSTNKELWRRTCSEYRRELPSYLNNNESTGEGRIWLNCGFSIDMCFSRDFSKYAELFNLNLWNVLDNYLHTNSSPVVVVDIGCGRGDALKEIKNIHGDRVQTVGFDFVRLSSHASLDRLVVGNFEQIDVPEDLKGTAHLVISNYVFRYFFEPLGKPLQKVKILLRKEGIAYIDLSGTTAKKFRFPSLQFNDILEIVP